MNNEQREFLVTKVEKYNEQIVQATKNIDNNIMMLAIGSAATVASVLMASQPDIFPSLITVTGTLIGTASNVGFSKQITLAIASRTNLANRVDEIEQLLELDALEQGKGIGR